MAEWPLQSIDWRKGDESMERVVICGHGASRPHSSANAFIPVPKGCKISFYTDFGKTISGNDADAIAAGTYGGQPKTVIEEFKTCPNFVYTPLTDAEKQAIEAAKPAGTILVFATTAAGNALEDLFKVWGAAGRKFDFHWACCQALQLKNTSLTPAKFVGSPKTGLNLTEMSDGFYQFDYDANKYSKVASK
jgi:hypothetical protein